MNTETGKGDVMENVSQMLTLSQEQSKMDNETFLPSTTLCVLCHHFLCHSFTLNGSNGFTYWFQVKQKNNGKVEARNRNQCLNNERTFSLENVFLFPVLEENNWFGSSNNYYGLAIAELSNDTKLRWGAK